MKRLLSFAVLVLILSPFYSNAKAEIFYGLENPEFSTPASGIGMISLWAFSTTPGADVEVEVEVDGKYIVQLSCGGERWDVQNEYPQYSNSLYSNCGASVNWGNIPPGVHSLNYRMNSSVGEIKTDTRLLTTLRFGDAKFADNFDLSEATSYIDQSTSEVVLTNVKVRSRETGQWTITNLRFKFVVSSQGLQLSGEESILPIGYTAAYRAIHSGVSSIWVASRISNDTIVFLNWNAPMSVNFGRSRSQDGSIVSENDTQIRYDVVNLFQKGVHGDTFGTKIGSYSVALTPTSLIATPRTGGQPTTFTKIAYGQFPAFYSRQFCSTNQICTGGTGTGWPLEGYFLKSILDNSSVTIVISPVDGGFETLQGSFDASRNGFIAYAPSPCRTFTNLVGLCDFSNDTQIHGVGRFFAIFDSVGLPRWWLSNDEDFIEECSEWEGPEDIRPHGLGVKITSRTTPNRDLNSFNASMEGSCFDG